VIDDPWNETAGDNANVVPGVVALGKGRAEEQRHQENQLKPLRIYYRHLHTFF